MTAPLAPGITVTTAVASPPPLTTVPTATWYVTGLAQRGATNTPIQLQSLSDYAVKLGARAGYTSLYDSLDLYFREGGLVAYVSRIAGPAAAAAFVILRDAATTPLNTLRVAANSVGAWGNALTVQVVAGSLPNTYQLVIAYGGITVEQSPNLSVPADAAAWSTLSNYVTVVDQGSATVAPANNPAVIAATPLATGADDNASVTEAMWTTALTAFPPDLGPGQVSAPGRTTDPAHQALVAHANANNRVAIMDGLDTPTAATLITSAVSAVTGGLDGSRAAVFAPWVQIPGIPTANGLPAAIRVAPPSALAAACIARTDIATGTGAGTICNPNTAAAGTPQGQSNYVLGVTQTFSAADRGALNAAGVDIIRSLATVVQVYGFRSLSVDPQYTQLNWGRLRMAIQNDAQLVATEIAQFSTIDAKGQMLGRLNGHLAGVLQAYWQVGALYGNTATAAFSVDTGPAVNTALTVSQGQVIAILRIRRSAMAEYTNLLITNVPLTQNV